MNITRRDYFAAHAPQQIPAWFVHQSLYELGESLEARGFRINLLNRSKPIILLGINADNLKFVETIDQRQIQLSARQEFILFRLFIMKNTVSDIAAMLSLSTDTIIKNKSKALMKMRMSEEMAISYFKIRNEKGKFPRNWSIESIESSEGNIS